METASGAPFTPPDFKAFFIDSGFFKEGAQIDFFVNPKILWVSAGVLLLFFVIISLILVYHWITYGYKATTVTLAMLVYFAGAFVIFSVILITLLAYGNAIS